MYIAYYYYYCTLLIKLYMLTVSKLSTDLQKFLVAFVHLLIPESTLKEKLPFQENYIVSMFDKFNKYLSKNRVN